jgi:hypothetical protein
VERSLGQLGKDEKLPPPVLELAAFHLWIGRGNFEKALATAKRIRETVGVAGALEGCLVALRGAPGPIPAPLLELAHDLALKAKRACAEPECRPVHLGSLAWTTFQRGDHAGAIGWAEQALALVPEGTPGRDSLEEDLEAYRHGRSPISGPAGIFRIELETRQIQ